MKTCVLLLVLFVASQLDTALAQTSSPRYRFVDVPVENNNGFFGCAGIVARDGAVNTCIEASPASIKTTGTLEFQPSRGLVLGMYQFPIVPEIGFESDAQNFDYAHFYDGSQRYSTNDQISLRGAIGFDTRFSSRQIFGDRAMLKVGAACLLTESFDYNPRRQGCRNLDLDNWFAKAFFAQNLRVPVRGTARSIAYIQGSYYYEMPDHDFAGKQHLQNDYQQFDDDGSALTIADATGYAILPLAVFSNGLSRWDVKMGGGISHLHQTGTITTGHIDGLITWSITPSLSASVAGKYSSRTFEGDVMEEDPEFITAQAYIEWYPGISIFGRR
jgi:hypothetical protein